MEAPFRSGLILAVILGIGAPLRAQVPLDLADKKDFRALRLDLLIEVSLRLHEEILGLEFGLARPSVGLFLGSMDDSSGTIFSVPKPGRDDPPLDHPEHPCANRGSHRDCYDDDRQIRNGRLPTMAMRASSPHHGVSIESCQWERCEIEEG